MLLTHTHPDHAPGTKRLVKETGAEVLAFTKKPKDGDVIPDRDDRRGRRRSTAPSSGSTCCTHPGHAPDHLCFYLEEERVLFTGDTVLDGMFSVVSPQPWRRHGAYVETLERLEKIRLARLCPGHGDVIDEPKARSPRVHRAPQARAKTRSTSW